MKLFFLLILLFSFSLSTSQELTEKYNSSLKAIEVFDSKENIVAHIKYNNVSEQWEYTMQSKSTGVTSVEQNKELREKLESRVDNLNNRIEEANTLIDEITQILRRKYGNEGLHEFNLLVKEGLKSITDSTGNINLNNDEVFKEFKSILIKYFQEVMNKDSVKKKHPDTSHSKEISSPKFARLLYRNAKFRAQPNPDSPLVYETQNLELVTILEEYDDSNWVKVLVSDNITGYITNKWIKEDPAN